VSEAPASSSNGQQLPREVLVGTTPRMSPNEMRVLKAQTGRTLESIMGDEADAAQALVWLELRRQGYSPTWDQAADVFAVYEAAADPTTAAGSTSSPRSAISGDAPPATSTP
jgi:hypothetical protein